MIKTDSPFNSKTVCITGATSGIGKACAYFFAKQGDDLILTGRRLKRLELLQKELSDTFSVKVEILCFDVQTKTEVFNNFAKFSKEKCIDILINNAGLALGREPFDEANIDDWDTMLHTNVNGLLYVTKACLPFLYNSSSPHIINIGSTAGKEVYENGNVYCASKFAVDAISKAMRIDLLKKAIKVTAINPGATETEFSIVRYKGDEKKAAGTYDGYQPLMPEDIAEVIGYVANLPKHISINDLTLTCLAQANSFYTYKS